MGPLGTHVWGLYDIAIDAVVQVSEKGDKQALECLVACFAGKWTHYPTELKHGKAPTKPAFPVSSHVSA